MFSVSLNKRRRGFVLVSVLLLGVVFISCAASFAWFARLQIKNALREKVSLSNRSMAQVLTLSIVAGIKSNTMVKYDSPLLEWFKPFFFPAADLGLWVVQIVPLDDKIPIRNLFLPDNNTLRNELRKPWEDMWLKLEGRDLVYRVLDFLDKNAKPRMGGAEHESYINRPLLDLSELLILEEMTPELLYGSAEKPGVADYCTLWSSGKINLNVAPVQVMEILPGLDKTLAEKIADYREREPLRRTADLRQIPGFPAKSVTALMNLADFSSRYFMIKMELLEDSGGGSSFSIVFDKTSGTVVRWEEI
jgi:DNA uptake protein ComE-like DNA-binding protein